MMKPAETRFRCTVSICHFLYSALLCVPKRGFQIRLGSRRGESGEGWQRGREAPTCKIEARRWETREELRDEGMNKTKSAGDWRLPSRILKLHLLQRTGRFLCVCMCVWVCTCTNPLRASESLCVCFACVCVCVCVLSVHIRVIQYPYRGPWLLPETHSSDEQMKNELKNNRRKGE